MALIIAHLFRFLTARRIVVLLLSLSLLAIVLALSLSSEAVPSHPSLSAYKSKPKSKAKADVLRVDESVSPKIFNPLRLSSHGPPSRQHDDYHAGSSWWADGDWLFPFSSSVTLDDERSLLPPLRRRQPIYCYIDDTATQSGQEEEAESELLLTWRRAWWARGFYPVILTVADALKNPAHATLPLQDLSPNIQHQLMSFLAWEMSDGGVLAHNTLLPIVSQDDSLLSFLWGGHFPLLTKWNELGDSLFVGPKDGITHFLRYVSNPNHIKLLQDNIAHVPDDVMKVDHGPASLASYNKSVVAKKYSLVADAFETGRVQGLLSLNSLITSHLHNSWQANFVHGIEVPKPHPKHMTALISDALALAQKLASCAETPMPSSCPPNDPGCTPCVARTPMRVMTPAQYHNKKTIFSIGMIPHPWTFAMLYSMKESFNVSWIRRETSRDLWLTTLTKHLLGTGVSSSRRIVALKEAVVGESTPSNTLWLVAEDEMPADLSWYFGFRVPQHGLDRGESESPVPADRLVKQDHREPDYVNGPLASDEDVAQERLLVDKAKHDLMHIMEDGARLRTSLEAWNTGHSEAWKFARAFSARNALELQALYYSGSGSEYGVAHA